MSYWDGRTQDMVFGCVSLLSLSTLAPILPTQFSITLVHPKHKPGLSMFRVWLWSRAWLSHGLLPVFVEFAISETKETKLFDIFRVWGKIRLRRGVSRQQPTSYKHFCYAATFVIRTKSEGASSYMENFNPSRKPHQLKSHAGPSLRQKSCRTLLWKRDKSLWCIGVKYFNSKYKYLTKSHKAAKNILILAVTKESHKVLILPHSLTCWNVHKQDYLWDSGCVILCNLLVTQILTTSRTETL